MSRHAVSLSPTIVDRRTLRDEILDIVRGGQTQNGDIFAAMHLGIPVPNSLARIETEIRALFPDVIDENHRDRELRDALALLDKGAAMVREAIG